MSRPFFRIRRQRKHPVITVEYIDQPSSPDEFEAYLQALYGLYDAQQPFRLLIDTRQLSGIFPLTYLKRQADFMQESEALAQKYLQRIALVVTSPMVSLLVRTICLLQEPVTEMKAFHEFEDAYHWVTTPTP